ncbi:MAG: hypothetical protein AAFQ82_23160, partial [Myxococcota bacterium]
MRIQEPITFDDGRDPMMTTEDSSFTPAPKRHGDRIWIRFDPEDTLASALEKARGDLGPGARFRGWDTHYAVYIFLALGRAPEPGDTVTLPTSPRDIRSVTETASRRIWAVANQSLSQRRPVWSHREQRMRMTQAQPGRRPLIRYAQHAEESSMRIREISPLGDSERMLLQTFGINVEAFSYPQQERLNALLAKVRGVRGALLHSTVQCRVHNGAVESATTVKLNGEELVIGRSYNPKEARLTQFIRCRMGATRVGAEHVLECSPKVVDEFTVRTAAGDVFNGLIFGGFDEDTAWTEIVGPTVVEVVPLNGSSGEMKRLEDAWIAVGASDGARSFCGFGCGSNDDLSRILKVPSEEEAERHALE